MTTKENKIKKSFIATPVTTDSLQFELILIIVLKFILFLSCRKDIKKIELHTCIHYKHLDTLQIYIVRVSLDVGHCLDTQHEYPCLPKIINLLHIEFDNNNTLSPIFRINAIH